MSWPTREDGFKCSCKKGVRRVLDEQGFDINGGKDRLGLTPEELRELAMTIPNDDAPYELVELSWLNIMAAIHHESAGGDATSRVPQSGN